jgi:hypothetical protein
MNYSICTPWPKRYSPTGAEVPTAPFWLVLMGLGAVVVGFVIGLLMWPQWLSTPTPYVPETTFSVQEDRGHARPGPAATEPSAFDQLQAEREAAAHQISRLYQLHPDVAQRFVDLAYRSALKHEMDPLLLLAIAGQESRFHPYLVSSVGAVGIAQIHPPAHPEKLARLPNGEADLLNPEINFDIAATIYKEYENRLKTEPLALQQYNGNLKDRRQAYANRVLSIRHTISSALRS